MNGIDEICARLTQIMELVDTGRTQMARDELARLRVALDNAAAILRQRSNQEPPPPRAA